MNLNIAICDDDAGIHSQLTSFFTNKTIAANHDFSLYHYHSGQELLDAYAAGEQFQILFLDIEMPGLSGIDTAAQIRQIPDRDVIILFLSSYPEYMQNCFPVHAHRFFIKPLTYEMFSSHIDSILTELRDNESKLLLLCASQEEFIVNIKDLIYIDTDKHFSNSFPLVFHCRNGTYHCKGTISEFEERLKTEYFVNPIRGILLNLRYVHRFHNHMIELQTGQQIPVVLKKEQQIKNLFHDYILDTRFLSL